MQKRILLFHIAVVGAVLPQSPAQPALDIQTSTKVTFPSQLGKAYQVYSTTNLDKTGWKGLGAPQTGTGEEITFFHTTKGDQKVFFKVDETAAPVQSSGGTPLILLQKARLNLQGQDLSGLTLTNLDLNNFSLANAKLIGADLSGSKLSQATIVGANFSNAKLIGVDLTSASGSGVNFSGADLQNARLAGQDGNFKNANLSGAWVAPEQLQKE